MTDRALKIEFINKCLTTKDGKKFTKSMLASASDAAIEDVCAKYRREYEEFVKNPPKKVIRFYASALNDEGKEVVFDGKAENENAYKEDIEKNGYEVIRIVPAKGHHLCRYCSGIADGSRKDVLCDDCQMTFGHYSYNEL